MCKRKGGISIVVTAKGLSAKGLSLDLRAGQSIRRGDGSMG
jgi:hypothetical protein